MPTKKPRAACPLDGIDNIVDDLASKGRRSRSSQIRLLVDEALYMRGLIKKPDFPSDSLEALKKAGEFAEFNHNPLAKYSSLQDLVEENREQLLKKSKLSEKTLDKISKTNQCTEVERLRIAIALGISEDDVAALQDNG